MTVKQMARKFTALEIHLRAAVTLSVALGLDEHFISDLKHLISVTKANREMS